MTLSLIMVCLIMLPLTPLLFLAIKIAVVVRPENKFIVAQSKIVSFGETVFESTPQLILQLYIILQNWSTYSITQWFSIATSSMSLCLANLDKYLININKTGFKNFVKYFPLIFLNSIFKVLSLVIIIVTIRGWSSLFIFLQLFLSFMINWKTQTSNVESDTLGWLTITNLENKLNATKIRMVSIYYNVVVYSVVLLIILFVANTVPENVYIYVHGFYWSDLELIQNIEVLNSLVGVTIAIEIISLLLDRIYGYFGMDMVFHQYLILSKEKDKDIEVARIPREYF